MEIKDAYNIWADQYDTNNNRTRDLEAVSLRTALRNQKFESCLEIGCGTGKNTEFLATIAKQVTAVDFSEEMLKKAKEKVREGNVHFVQGDITREWAFADKQYDLVTFSLVLEHIEILAGVFEKLSKIMLPEALLYIGELHPFKQYMGSKARFDNGDVQTVVSCFNHNISDFTDALGPAGFSLIDVTEYFDEGKRDTVPRILTLLCRKN